MPNSTRLVADIGGTNTRIALFDQNSGEFRAHSNYVNRDFAQLENVIEAWLAGLQEPAPEVCCIAVAAPPSADRVDMVNMDWSFSCSDIVKQFGFSRLRRINDFESNAYALPHLQPQDLELLHGGGREQAGRLATVGPGTGLGGAILDSAGGVPHSIACEPGHMGLAPGTELELEVFRLLLPRHGDIYAELLVSGPGLLRLYQALAQITGVPVANGRSSPAEISRSALAGEDTLCVLTLETFCALLGSVCGDFLLANGSYGGLYLAGGIVPRMTSFLSASTFHQRLIQKGAMGANLTKVPVYAIRSGQPGLVGAAHAPL